MKTTLALSALALAALASLSTARAEPMMGIMLQSYLYCSSDATEGDAANYALILNDAAIKDHPTSIRVIRHDGTDWQTVRDSKVDQVSEARVPFADGGKGSKYVGEGFSILRGTETTPDIRNDRAVIDLQVEGQTIQLQTTCSTVS